MGRILVRWKSFRNNLEMLCHPISNWLWLILNSSSQKLFLSANTLRYWNDADAWGLWWRGYTLRDCTERGGTTDALMREKWLIHMWHNVTYFIHLWMWCNMCCSVSMFIYVCIHYICMYTYEVRHIMIHLWTSMKYVTSCRNVTYSFTHCNTLQHTATHCNTLQHTATHCNTLLDSYEVCHITS